MTTDNIPIYTAVWFAIFAIGLIVGIDKAWAFALGIGVGLGMGPLGRWMERL